MSLVILNLCIKNISNLSKTFGRLCIFEKSKIIKLPCLFGKSLLMGNHLKIILVVLSPLYSFYIMSFVFVSLSLSSIKIDIKKILQGVGLYKISTIATCFFHTCYELKHNWHNSFLWTFCNILFLFYHFYLHIQSIVSEGQDIFVIGSWSRGYVCCRVVCD